MKGQLVVFEGTDGSGKATQARLFFEKLQRKGVVCELVSFPRYDSQFGALVGRYLAGEFGSLSEVAPEFVALLYALDRYDFKQSLEHKLSLGVTLVCDRYLASNLAHQGAKFTRKKDQDDFVHWAQVLESRLPQPDQTVFLNLAPEAASDLLEGADRAKAYRKGVTRDLHESDETYLERTHGIYRRLARKQKWVWVDCAFREKDHWVIRSREEIAVEVFKRLEKTLFEK